jgi:hypothetical protein
VTIVIESYGEDDAFKFDSATSWVIGTDGNLDIVGDTRLIATFKSDVWAKVYHEPTADSKLLLDEATDLVGLVDGGEFTNQDSDWKERAEALLDKV